MKAIISNGTTYKVTVVKGDFTICEDVKGKIKMFQTSTIEVVEAEFGKVKIYKTSKPSEANGRYIAEMKNQLRNAKWNDHNVNAKCNPID